VSYLMVATPMHRHKMAAASEKDDGTVADERHWETKEQQ